tara:strand:- start:159 stop:611 length:453 start_codon:yes stop_codon:yes gene_type:complete
MNDIKEELHKCNKFGDKRDGWDNCSICGETDWKGLYKYKFETVEVINLVTQSVALCDRLIKEELTYRHTNKGVKLLVSDNVEFSEESTEESNLKNNTVSFVEENIDTLTYHIESLSKKNKMLLFIQSHDFIFNTKWVDTMRSMRRWGFEV